MVGIGLGIFIQQPGQGNERILHPARVVGHKDEVFTAQVADQGLSVESGQDVLVYYEKNREFVKQSARIHCVDQIASDQCELPNVTDDAESDINGPHLLVNFTTNGKPVSAESRQHYRVSTVISGLKAQVGDESHCSVLDVSSTGFSAIASAVYTIGNIVSAVFQHEGKTYSGEACIQSVTDLGKSRIRYGLHCVDDRAANDNLAKGLQQISVYVQREQLRRLAGAR